MEILVALGEIYGAEKFIPVTGAPKKGRFRLLPKTVPGLLGT
jgi:hypothetical protein